MAAPVIIVKDGSCVIEVHKKGGGPNTLLASMTVPEASFNFSGSHVEFDNKQGGPQNGEYRFEFFPGGGGGGGNT